MSFLTMSALSAGISPVLFQNLSLHLSPGSRLGIIAPNGGGKSTLLRLIAGLAEPAGGEITFPRGTRLGYAAQTLAPSLLPLSMREAIATGLPKEESDALWRVDMFLAALNIPDSLHDLPLAAQSGGWRQMALLARTLVAEPDILLLDEPTNHLDQEKIACLENWLADNARDSIQLIVSHDRAFLDACTNQTLFLRPMESLSYPCAYRDARRLLKADDDAQATLHAQTLKEIRRLRQSASELKNIGLNSRSDAAQKKSKQMAGRAAAIEESLNVLHREKERTIRLASREGNARTLLILDDVAVTTPEGRLLFRTGKQRILVGERIILMGPNGAGKTRLLHHILAAAHAPEEAQNIRIAPSITWGYADQHMSHLPDQATPFDYIAETFRQGDQRSRTLLAGAGFSITRQEEKIETFSPGEKARLGLLALRLTQPHFYLLDEPTNHVDIEGQEKLEEEICLQEASALIVSHDRRFVQNTGTRYWHIEAGRLVEREA